MREVKLLLIACYIVLLISPARLRAQTAVTSTILGTVTDPQGAAVAGAEVRLLDVDTGRERTAVSGQDGNYVFPDLNAGRYEVEVSNPGFKLTRSQSVTIGAAGTTQRINIALALAGVSQQVAVTAAQVELVHTDDANVNVALTAEAVRDIPVQGRNFLNYAQLAPLFNSGNGQLNWGVAQQTTVESTKSLNLGGSENMVGYYIDGMNNNDNWGGSQLANVNTNAVQEVSVQSLNYSAAYTRDIGQITLTVKSGTNKLHGSIYDYYQGSNINSLDSYTERIDPTAKKRPYHENQFGGGLGGPVYIPHLIDGRSRAFFFVAYEGIRKRGTVPIFGYVPTAAERTGDFSAWLSKFPGDPRYIIYNPFTFDPATQTRQPYSNNIIGNPDPRAVAYLSHSPLPNFTSSVPGDIRNWEGTGGN